jgi:excisionase family DNA binding protein
MAAQEPDPKRLLTSWKEIAEYLGVSVRTAQKWEAEMGLPVHRLPGEKGRVSAEAAGLERWKRETLGKPHWWASVRFFRVYAAVATALVVVAGGVFLGGYLASNWKGPPARFHFEFKSLVVTDERGRELWRKSFEDPFGPGITPESMLRYRQAWFGDLDEDGHVELLFTYDPVSRVKNGSFLICFSDQGKEKWRFVPGRQVSSPAESFPPPYMVARVAVAPLGKDRAKRVLVTSHHLTWYPCQVVALRSTGAVLGEYWHSGHLDHMDLTDLDGDGSDEVLLAGVSNGYKAATLVVLDPLNLDGASWEEDGACQLEGFGPGREKARLLFPRSCINRKFESYNGASLMAVQGDSIKIDVNEKRQDADAVVIYRLDKRLRLVHFAVSDRLPALHRELEAAGQLDHVLTEREIAELGKIRTLKALER